MVGGHSDLANDDGDYFEALVLVVHCGAAQQRWRYLGDHSGSKTSWRRFEVMRIAYGADHEWQTANQ